MPTERPALPRHWTLLLVALSLIAGLSAAFFLDQRPKHILNVVMQVDPSLHVVVIKQGYSNENICLQSAREITRAMKQACPQCEPQQQRCLQKPSPRQLELLNGRAIDAPLVRIPNGVLVYESTDESQALQACQETARHMGGNATCSTPGSAGIAAALATMTPLLINNVSWPALALKLVLPAAILCALLCALLIWTQRWHGRFSHDSVDSGPQKFHDSPVPRIGGVAIAASLALMVLCLEFTTLMPEDSVDGFMLLALAAMPAFLGGLGEDLTKKVGVLARLLLTMAAGGLASLLVGATLDRLDVPGLDHLLQHWPLFALVFTAFAVGGVANAINIIDGYNGLAAGFAVLALSAFAWVSMQVGDQVVLIASLVMLGSVLGFLIWNWPSGKIFMGDGGAYLLGFWLAELGVLLVVRNPSVSPWFPLAIMIYPIWETVFSIYRKSLLRGHSSGRPDGLHAHMLIYKRLLPAGHGPQGSTAKKRRNNTVAIYICLFNTILVMVAILVWNRTPWLLLCAIMFALFYTRLYMLIVKFRAPAWLILRFPFTR